MKNFMLFSSHILCLVLVAVIAFMAGVGIGYKDPNGELTDMFESMRRSSKTKNKEDETKNVVEMGFHL